MKPNLRSLVLLNGMPSVILKKKMKAQILHVPNFQLIDTLPKASKKLFFEFLCLFCLKSKAASSDSLKVEPIKKFPVPYEKKV